jgi:prepilin-type N-terminal cleavage/methylation domain-containing protein
VNTRQNQRGLSLIEVMIGLSIGLFLLAGLTQFFDQNRRAYAYQQSQGNQQISERLVDIIMRSELQQAGFVPMTGQSIINRPFLFPAAAPFAAGEAIFGTEGTANVAVNGVTGLQPMANDTLSVRYWDGVGIVDCIGGAVPAATLTLEQIAIDGARLTCATNGGPARPLLGDDQGPISQQVRVLGLAIGYGLDTDNDGAVDTYRRASGVADWQQVRVAEVELTIQSASRPPETLSVTVALENNRGAT